jgi:arylsulfatase A-like enzyme
MKPRVLIVSFDALRPDMVTPELMPNLCKFVAEGTHFPEARSTFPTETRVNQTAMITGCYPERHGIVGNRFQDADASPGKLFNTGDETQLAKGDKRLGGKLVDVPVLGEILDANGLSYAVISAGTPGGTRMLNHKAENLGGFRLSLHRPDVTQPTGAIDKILETCGPIPPHSVPSLEWIRYATNVYLDYVEPNLTPDVMVLWYCEPDNSYHQIGLGTPGNLEALRTVDREFGRIWAREAKKPLEERLHIVTMSDHGMVTLLGSKLDLAAKFREAGFTVGETTEDGSDVALALSSAGGIYVNDSDPALIQRVLAWLQGQDWCGPLFTRTGDGALLHDHIWAVHRRAADIGIVLKSSGGSNTYGIEGGTVHDCVYPNGGGMHGGLHEREVRCWLAIQGPDVRNGYASPVTAGVVDILPTVLNFLGLKTPDHIQGRVLREGLEAFAKEALPECHRELHSAEGANGYRAYIEHDHVGKYRYLHRAWSERV